MRSGDFSPDIPGAGIDVGGKKVQLKDILVRAPKGRLEARKVALAFPEVMLDSSHLKNLRLSLDINEKRAAMRPLG